MIFGMEWRAWLVIIVVVFLVVGPEIYSRYGKHGWHRKTSGRGTLR